MNAASLRRQVDDFFADLAHAAAAGSGLQLHPSPGLDATYADLFRPEARAVAADLRGLSSAGVWQRFVDAGCRRRAAAEARRALVAALARLPPTDRPGGDPRGFSPAARAVEGEHQAALLVEHLKSRFGRRWDETPRAADLLRDLWSEGWGRTVWDLLSFLGMEDPHGEILETQLAH